MSGFYPEHLRELIRETLRYLEPEIPFNEHAVELLMLTAAQETQLGRFLVQLRGPARGIYQVEPATEDYVLTAIRAKYPELADKVLALNAPADGQGGKGDRDMIFNLAYGTAVARCLYWLKPGPIPEDLAGKALYYKRWYNTPAGKATAAEAILAYQRCCAPATA